MQLLLSLIEQYGLWLVFAAVLVEQLGMPLPAYPVLIVTGAVSAQGDYSAPEVILVAILGCVIADLVWYYAGFRLGRRVLRLAGQHLVHQQRGGFHHAPSAHMHC